MIIGFSARKQGGKNTSANILAGHILNSVGFATRVDGSNGKLMVVNDDSKWVELDLTCRIGEYFDWLEEEVHPFIKLYSFADPLKEFCINVLGLAKEQCYGTDEQKNSNTHLRWLNFKKFLPAKTKKRIQEENRWRSFVTGREVLQIFGTDIIREIYSDAWVSATIKKITEEQSACAIVPDVRFENEVIGLQEIGGKVVRLTRSPCPDDCHISEMALDNFHDFDAILENESSTIQEQAVKLAEIMKEIG